jgi:DNA-binding NarL/FixJ family response regulator
MLPTERELEVLTLLAQGGTKTSIAAERSYSVSTIRRNTMIIYRNLGAANSSDAVSRAITLGFPVASGRRR